MYKYNFACLNGRILWRFKKWLVKKKPISEFFPSNKKQPKILAPPNEFRGGSIVTWRFNGVDKNGEFSWLNIESSEKYKEIIEKLASVETLTEKELKSKEHHFIDLDKLSRKAQDRLIEIKLDDLDSVFSIRLSAKERVICVFRKQDDYCYFRVLWWDPKHQVCPSKKKHT